MRTNTTTRRTANKESENMKKDSMYMAEIVEIPVNKIKPFPNHPFCLYQGERLDDLVESIKEHGIMNPVIVLKQGTEYEMLSGHNRWNAAMLAGLKKIPAIVKEKLSREEAYVYVIETNLMQRSFADLTPSEKAAVLKVRYDKEACQGKRNDIIAEIARLEGKEIPENYDTGSKKMHTRDRIGKDYDLSGSSVARLLKLNDLIVPFKDWVDMGVITEKVGVQLAFLSQDEQKLIFRVVRADKSKITVDAVIKFRSHSGELTEGSIRKYLRVDPKKKSYKVPARIVEKYFQGMDVSFVIVLQDKQQIEAIFEKYYRTLYGNCAWQLFLGSLELETCKYYSELLGKETIHAYTYTKNYGRQAGSSRQEQLIERDLMKPDEVRALPKKECVLYTPYYGVVRDLKFDMTRHPFYNRISDGNGVPPYVWGEADLAVGGVRILDPSYAGELTVLPKANGVLLEVED